MGNLDTNLAANQQANLEADRKESSRYSSRKFLFCLLLVAVATGMEYLGKLSPTLAGLLQWIGGIYCGFNVAQKGVEWISTK